MPDTDDTDRIMARRLRLGGMAEADIPAEIARIKHDVEQATQHLHVSATGALTVCSFPDRDPDMEYEQLSAILSAQGLPDDGPLPDMRQEIVAWYMRQPGHVSPLPVATRPTCFYFDGETAESGEGCDDYMFTLEPYPLAHVGTHVGLVCGQHIVDWTSDRRELAQAWVLKEWRPRT
jgi:hypothetical protein